MTGSKHPKDFFNRILFGLHDFLIQCVVMDLYMVIFNHFTVGSQEYDN